MQRVSELYANNQEVQQPERSFWGTFSSLARGFKCLSISPILLGLAASAGGKAPDPSAHRTEDDQLREIRSSIQHRRQLSEAGRSLALRVLDNGSESEMGFAIEILTEAAVKGLLSRDALLRHLELRANSARSASEVTLLAYSYRTTLTDVPSAERRYFFRKNQLAQHPGPATAYNNPEKRLLVELFNDPEPRNEMLGAQIMLLKRRLNSRDLKWTRQQIDNVLYRSSGGPESYWQFVRRVLNYRNP